MFQEMVVGEDSADCSKVTVPETLESPRRRATGQALMSVRTVMVGLSRL